MEARLLLATCMALLFPLPAFSQEELEWDKGGLQCEVVGRSMLGVADGRPAEVEESQDGYKIGDVLFLRYRLNYFQDMMDVEVDLLEPSATLDKRYFWFSVANPRAEHFKFSDDGAVSLNSAEHEEKMELNSGYWELYSIFGLMQFQRYYKDDWHGIISRNAVSPGKMSLDVTMLDCRIFGAGPEEFVQALKRKYGS